MRSTRLFQIGLVCGVFLPSLACAGTAKVVIPITATVMNTCAIKSTPALDEEAEAEAQSVDGSESVMPAVTLRCSAGSKATIRILNGREAPTEDRIELRDGFAMQAAWPAQDYVEYEIYNDQNRSVARGVASPHDFGGVLSITPARPDEPTNVLYIPGADGFSSDATNPIVSIEF